jgi:ATP-dependent protease ClpP protease subunit
MNLTKRNDEDDNEAEDILKMLGTKTRAVVRSTHSKEYFFPLDKELYSFTDFDELVNILLCANPNDVVRIYISSGGGRLDVAQLIVSRIQEAQDRGVIVIGELGFIVASAATFIAFACTDLIISPFTSLMIHNWKSGDYGNATELYHNAEFNKKQSREFMSQVYQGFLTESELLELEEHPKDLWFNAKEVNERWNNVQALCYDDSDEPEFNLKDFIKQQILEIQAEEKVKPAAKPKAPAKKTTKTTPAKTTEK